MDNTMQSTVSCVNHILTQMKLLLLLIMNSWSVTGPHSRSAKWCHLSFYFFIFRLHMSELGAFVLIMLPLNLICVRRRPGMAGIRPKVVTYKWLCVVPVAGNGTVTGSSANSAGCWAKTLNWCRTQCYAFAALCTSGKQPPTVQSSSLPTFKLHPHRYVSSLCIALPIWR